MSRRSGPAREPVPSQSDEDQNRSASSSFSLVLLEEDGGTDAQKRLVRQRLVLEGLPTADELEAALEHRVRELAPGADQVVIYVYESRAHYDSGAGLCIASAMWPTGDWRTNRAADPTIVIAHYRVRELRAGPSKKPGLSESQRKRVFWDLVQLEDQAEREAGQNLDRYDELCDRYRRALASKHGLTHKELTAIVDEGLAKGWPSPPYRGGSAPLLSSFRAGSAATRTNLIPTTSRNA